VTLLKETGCEGDFFYETMAWDEKNLPSITHAICTAVAATLSLALTRTADPSPSSFRSLVCKPVCT
jgi:hypothetical protein